MGLPYETGRKAPKWAQMRTRRYFAGLGWGRSFRYAILGNPLDKTLLLTNGFSFPLNARDRRTPENKWSGPVTLWFTGHEVIHTGYGFPRLTVVVRQTRILHLTPKFVDRGPY
jgi:hypothetical protein